ncbi:hypothetical protein [Streptomyces pseudogriseolus]|uniref:hypothetical protein n=1 Tax=Streptomyces pseudogriseolus TaxID=36817 RepID=UPI003FA32F2D
MLVQRLYDDEREKTVQQISDRFGVHRFTVHGRLDKPRPSPARPRRLRPPTQPDSRTDHQLPQ